MKKLFTLILFVGLYMGSYCQSNKQIRVLQLNIWQEGKSVANGYQHIVDDIANVNADFVTLSEVRNYNNTRFCDRIVASLAEKGLTYYSFYSYDSAILSKTPIVDSATIFPCVDDHGSIYRLNTYIYNREVAIYTAHLDYLNCAYYAVRGYDANTFSELAKPLTDTVEIMRINRASMRDDATALFIDDARMQLDKGALVFLGGDFNEPSPLDWTIETSNLNDHQGLVIDWTVSGMLARAGYKDAYRIAYPNPVTHPGFTYPADCDLASIKQLAWSPKADDRERIDYVFYYPTKGLKLVNAVIVGPSGSICRAQRTPSASLDSFITPKTKWATDHKGVLITFTIE